MRLGHQGAERFPSLSAKVERLVRGCGTAAGAALVLLGLVVVGDIALRNFGFAVPGAAELAGLLLALLIFLAVASTEQRRGHVSIELFVDALPAPAKRVAQVLAFSICLAATLTMALVSTQSAFTSFVEQEFEYGTVHLPLWPGKSVVAVGLWLLAVQQAVNFLKLGRRTAPRAEEGAAGEPGSFI